MKIRLVIDEMFHAKEPTYMAIPLVWNTFRSSMGTQMSSHLSNRCYSFETTDICCVESRLLFVHKEGNPLAFPTYLSNAATVRSINMLKILQRIERYLRRYFKLLTLVTSVIIVTPVVMLFL
jgi:hypothetical protein